MSLHSPFASSSLNFVMSLVFKKILSDKQGSPIEDSSKISATLVRVTDFSCADEGEERRGVVGGGRLLAEREQWEWGVS